MKISAAFVAGSLALATPSLALAQETPVAQLTEMELAREIVEQGFPEVDRMAMFTGFVDVLLDQMIAASGGQTGDPEMRAILNRHAENVMATTEDVLSRHIDHMMATMVVAYAETFTRDELEGLHGFITTPAGHGFLARSITMMSHPAYAEANQAYMTEYMGRVPALQAQLQADVAELLASRRK